MDGGTVAAVAALLAPLYALYTYNLKLIVKHEKRLSKLELQNEAILRYLKWLNGEEERGRC